MNQRKVGSLISYVQMFLGVIISLFYTPYMIKILGQSEYGLYNTVASTISMMSVLSLGFNSSYIRYYSRYKEENNAEGISKLNGLFIIIFTAIGFVALACGLYISEHLNIVFKDGLTVGEYALAKKLLILLTVNLAISFPMSVFADIISAHEQFVFLKLLGVIKTVCSPLLTIPLLFAGYHSVAIVTITIVLALFTDTMYLIFVVGHLKEKFVFNGFEKGLFREILTYTSFIAINIVVDQINWNIDKLLLARYKGTIAVAVYSVGYTLNNYYSMVSTAISGVFTPMVHRIINDTHSDKILQRTKLTELFIRVGRIQFLILALVASGLVFFGKPFIMFWAGVGYEGAYYVVLLLTIPATIPLIQNVGIEIQRAQNKHQFRSIVYLIMALLNLGVSIVFCQWWGAIGSALGTAISLIVANGFLINVYYQKECNIDVIVFWKSIAGMFKGLIAPVVLGIMVMSKIRMDSFGKLTGWIVVYSALYCISCWFFSMNQYEKGLLLKPIKMLRNRMERH